MNRKQKIYWFIRREVMWFMIGFFFSAMLTYNFHLDLGNWFIQHDLLYIVLLSILFLVMIYFERSAKQR